MKVGRWAILPNLSPQTSISDSRHTQETFVASTQINNEPSKTDAEKLDAIVKKYADKMPRPVRRFILWVRKPYLRRLRLVAGILFVICGFIGFLPILGFWMMPLGLIILAQDSEWLQRRTLNAVTWLESKLGS